MEFSSDQTVEKFLAADTATRLALVREPADAEAVRTWMGDELFTAYLTLGAAPGRHLAGAGPNLIFLPGVMGSILGSQTLGGIWWFDVRNTKRLNDLRLSSDGSSDANSGHHVVPIGVDFGYDPFLAAALDRPGFSHRAHPYDWRKPIEASTAALRDAIVAAYQENGHQPVNLVAHSMGGLVARTTLMRFPELWDQEVGRVVFLGTPHFGSPAVAAYLKLHFRGFNALALLGRLLNRETFRSMWGVLGLLPAPAGIYPGTREGQQLDPAWKGAYRHPCANFDLYDAEAWNLRLDPQATDHLQAILDAAAGLHSELYESHQALEQDIRDRMAVIAGVGHETLFRFEIKESAPLIGRTTREITSRSVGNPHREGDGRVPVASAMLDWVPTRYTRGEHSHLPALPDVQADVFSFLSDGTMDRLETTVEGALLHHLGGEPMRSAAVVDAGFPAVIGEDPGYLDFGEPDSAELDKLQLAVEAGEVPEFDRIRIL